MKRARRRNGEHRRPAGRIEIDITWHLHTSWRVETLLRRVARHVAAAEGFRTGELSIVVVGARAMATLHKRYLSIAGPTDVLTFDLGTAAPHKGWHGQPKVARAGQRTGNLRLPMPPRRRGHLDAEIVLCAGVARRVAAASGGGLREARRELALYLVHGILHLSAYDDHRSTDAHRMHAREDELFAELGLGPICTEPVGTARI